MIATFPVRMVFIAIIATMSFLALPLRAQGYVDPGAGAMLWQILAAAFVGAVFFFRRFILGRFRGGKPPQPGSGTGENPDSHP
jgi:hypothetical protein